jgi:hypothetical protein
MAESPNEDPNTAPLNERLLDLLVYVPAGIAASVVEDFPAMAERGRAKLGVRVSSARAIGMFAVKAGHDEFLRRSAGLRHRGGTSDGGTGPDRPDTAATDESVSDGGAALVAPTGERPGSVVSATSTVEVAASPPPPPASSGSPPGEATPHGAQAPVTPPDNAPPDNVASPDNGAPPGNGHVPPVSTLSIPGFDTLSASQVVQRLDGLNRSELVAVRAYEASTRGRRTILSRVDQLLDERS